MHSPPLLYWSPYTRPPVTRSPGSSTSAASGSGDTALLVLAQRSPEVTPGARRRLETLPPEALVVGVEGEPAGRGVVPECGHVPVRHPAVVRPPHPVPHHLLSAVSRVQSQLSLPSTTLMSVLSLQLHSSTGERSSSTWSNIAES